MSELRPPPVELTDWLRAELERRADAEAPNECCGLIGRGEKGIGLWAADNAAHDPLRSFAIAPESQFGILKQMKQRGEELAGVYHSHPHSGPEPSKLDRAIAATMADFFPGLTWVIIGFDVCVECDGAGFDLGADLGIERPCPACGGEGHGGPRFFSGVLA